MSQLMSTEKGRSKHRLHGIITNALNEARPKRCRIGHIDGIKEGNLACSDTFSEFSAADSE